MMVKFNSSTEKNIGNAGTRTNLNKSTLLPSNIVGSSANRETTNNTNTQFSPLILTLTKQTNHRYNCINFTIKSELQKHHNNITINMSQFVTLTQGYNSTNENHVLRTRLQHTLTSISVHTCGYENLKMQVNEKHPCPTNQEILRKCPEPKKMHQSYLCHQP